MTLRDHILHYARPIVAPNQKTYLTISLTDQEAIAAAYSLSKRESAIAALDVEVWPQRYLRNMGSLGVDGQKRLLSAKALVVGAGGLGGTIAQLLARLGLGKLVIADGDSFNESNLNRQTFSLEENLGKTKVQVIQSEIQKINSATEVEIFAGFVAEKELKDLIQGTNVAMDALDNMPSRFILEKVCKEMRVPLVHGAVAGFSGQVMVIYPEDTGFGAIYGDPQKTPQKGIEVELGNLAGIVSMVASAQVQEAVKIITGLGRPLKNRLLFLDSLNALVEIISLK